MVLLLSFHLHRIRTIFYFYSSILVLSHMWRASLWVRYRTASVFNFIINVHETYTVTYTNIYIHTPSSILDFLVLRRNCFLLYWEAGTLKHCKTLQIFELSLMINLDMFHEYSSCLVLTLLWQVNFSWDRLALIRSWIWDISSFCLHFIRPWSCHNQTCLLELKLACISDVPFDSRKPLRTGNTTQVRKNHQIAQLQEFSMCLDRNNLHYFLWNEGKRLQAPGSDQMSPSSYSAHFYIYLGREYIHHSSSGSQPHLSLISPHTAFQSLTMKPCLLATLFHFCLSPSLFRSL